MLVDSRLRDEFSEAGASEDAETWRARLPGLVRPFAIVGAVAGFFSMLAVVEPGPKPDEGMPSPFLGMAIAAVAGALVGFVLRRWRRLHDPLLTPDGVWIRLAILVLPVSTIAGGLVSRLHFGTADRESIVCGTITGLLFLPSCRFVLGASTRAARARQGSLVADADRRSVHTTLLAIVAFAAALTGPALLWRAFTPWLSILEVPVCILTCAVTVALLARLGKRDEEASRRLDVITTQASGLDDVADGCDRAAIDLGLGYERWGRATELATYRTLPSAEVLVRGSLEDATKAIEQSRKHHRRAMIVAIAALVWTTSCAVLGQLFRP